MRGILEILSCMGEPAHFFQYLIIPAQLMSKTLDKAYERAFFIFDEKSQGTLVVVRKYETRESLKLAFFTNFYFLF